MNRKPLVNMKLTGLTVMPLLLAIPVTAGFLMTDSMLFVRALYICSLLLMALSHLFLQKHYAKEQKRMVTDLTAMLQALAHLKDLAVFPNNDDVLESSLQNQFNKTVSLLRKQQTMMEQEKDEVRAYISSISHQMKTPIAAIRIHTELLMENHVSEEDRRTYLDAIYTALKRLEFFASGMVQSSRLETGLIQLKIEYCSVTQTILQAVMQIRHRAEAKNIDVRLTGSTADVQLPHDRRWTVEAIVNILDNAVKYSPDSSYIEIACKKYEFFYCLSVDDEGKGIPSDDMTKIFQRFYRSCGSDEQEGLGLGLYISRKIVTMQGGSIAVESLEKGSRFKIYLPLQQ